MPCKLQIKENIESKVREMYGELANAKNSLFKPIIERLSQTKLARNVYTDRQSMIDYLNSQGVDNLRQLSKVSAGGFYSNATTSMENLKDKNPKTPQQWVKALTDVQKNGGVRNVVQELNWIGLEDYLKDYQKQNNLKSISYDVVEQYIRDNQIEIVEVSKGTENYKWESLTENQWSIEGTELAIELEDGFYNIYDGGDLITERDTLEDAKKRVEEIARETYNAGIETKYSEYQLQGGENYREVLLTLPNKKLEKQQDKVEEYLQNYYSKKDLEKLGYTFSKRTKEQIIEQEGKDYFEDLYGNKRFKYEYIAKAPDNADDFETMSTIISEDNLIKVLSYSVTYINNVSLPRELQQIADDDYRSDHWGESNVLAHIRLNERILPNGERVLFVEEIQSDWNQGIKKQGVRDTKKQKKLEALIAKNAIKMDEISEKVYEKRDKLHDDTSLEEREALQKEIKTLNKEGNKLGRESSLLQEELNNLGKLPNNPYKKTDQWVGMAMRKVYQMAAQEGFDRVAWITGEQSADRYDLSKQVENIDVQPRPNGDTFIFINMISAFNVTLNVGKDGVVKESKSNTDVDYNGKKLSDILGKELAEKIINSETIKKDDYTYSDNLEQLGEKGVGYLNKEGQIAIFSKTKKEADKSLQEVVSEIQEEGYTLKGEDLKVGGEGMKTFYNSILPKVAKKEAQRIDKNATVEVVKFTSDYSHVSGRGLFSEYKYLQGRGEWRAGEWTPEGIQEDREGFLEDLTYTDLQNNYVGAGEQLSIKITPKIKETTSQGIPQFLKTPNGIVYGFVTPENDVYIDEEATTNLEEANIDISNQKLSFQTINEETKKEIAKGLTLLLSDPQLKGKIDGLVSRGTIEQIANKKGVSKIQQDILKEVLDLDKFQTKKFDYGDFLQEISNRIIPLEVIESDSYSDYGANNTGVEPIEATTHIYNTNLEHGIVGHFSGDFPSPPKVLSTSEVFLQDTSKDVIRLGTRNGENVRSIKTDLKPDSEGNYDYSEEVIERFKKEYIERFASELTNFIPLEIRQLKDNFVVVRSDATLTEENIAENVLTVTSTREKAQEYIDNVVKVESTNKGMFGHTRVWKDNEGNVYIAEIQSDSYQKERAKELLWASYQNDPSTMNSEQHELMEIYENNLEILSELNIHDSLVKELRDTEERIIETESDENKSFHNKLKEERDKIVSNIGKDNLDNFFEAEKNYNQAKQQIFDKASLKDKQFLAHEKNYTERLLREEIKRAANEGAKTLSIPTPRTLALIEGYIEDEGRAPYKVLEAEDKERLDVGDIIDYGGVEYIVIDASYSGITVVDLGGMSKANSDDLLREQAEHSASDDFYEFERLIESNFITKEEWEELKENNNFPYSMIGIELEDVSSEMGDVRELNSGKIEDLISEYYLKNVYTDAATILGDVGYKNIVELEDGEILYTTNNVHSENFKQPHQYESRGVQDFDIGELSNSEQTVLKKYEKLIKKFRIVRPDVKLKTDDRGNEWVETEIKEEDKQSPLIAFQVSTTTSSTPSLNQTAIHEFGHLWNKWAKANRPDLWNKGIELINDSEYLRRVQENPAYQHLSLEQQQDEALALAIGEKGESFIDKNKSKDFKKWLTKLWNAIKKSIGITKYTAKQLQEINLDEFAEAVAVDLLKGNEIRKSQQDAVQEINQLFGAEVIAAINEQTNKPEISVPSEIVDVYYENEKKLEESENRSARLFSKSSDANKLSNEEKKSAQKIFKAAFPNVEIVEDESDFGGEGMVKDGKVHISLNKESLETRMHELGGHIFFTYMKENVRGVYDLLMSKKDEIPKSVYDKVRSEYPELERGSEQFYDEVFATYMGMINSGAVKRAANKKGLFADIKRALNNIYQTIMKRLGFSDYMSLESFNEQTLSEALTYIGEGILNGSVVTEITTEDVGRMLGSTPKYLKSIGERLNESKESNETLNNAITNKVDKSSKKNKAKVQNKMTFQKDATYSPDNYNMLVAPDDVMAISYSNVDTEPSTGMSKIIETISSATIDGNPVIKDVVMREVVSFSYGNGIRNIFTKKDIQALSKKGVSIIDTSSFDNDLTDDVYSRGRILVYSSEELSAPLEDIIKETTGVSKDVKNGYSKISKNGQTIKSDSILASKINRDALENVKEGDRLTLEVEFDTQWNKDIVSEFVESEEATNRTRTIIVTAKDKNGDIVGFLPAISNIDSKKTDSRNIVYGIREAAWSDVVHATREGSLKSDAQIVLEERLKDSTLSDKERANVEKYLEEEKNNSNSTKSPIQVGEIIAKGVNRQFNLLEEPISVSEFIEKSEDEYSVLYYMEDDKGNGAFYDRDGKKSKIKPNDNKKYQTVYLVSDKYQGRVLFETKRTTTQEEFQELSNDDIHTKLNPVSPFGASRVNMNIGDTVSEGYSEIDIVATEDYDSTESSEDLEGKTIIDNIEKGEDIEKEAEKHEEETIEKRESEILLNEEERGLHELFDLYVPYYYGFSTNEEGEDNGESLEGYEAKKALTNDINKVFNKKGINFTEVWRLSHKKFKEVLSIIEKYKNKAISLGGFIKSLVRFKHGGNKLNPNAEELFEIDEYAIAPSDIARAEIVYVEGKIPSAQTSMISEKYIYIQHESTRYFYKFNRNSNISLEDNINVALRAVIKSYGKPSSEYDSFYADYMNKTKKSKDYTIRYIAKRNGVKTYSLVSTKSSSNNEKNIKC